MNDYSRFDVHAQSIVVARKQADLVRDAAEARLLRSADAERADTPHFAFLGNLRRSVFARFASPAAPTQLAPHA